MKPHYNSVSVSLLTILKKKKSSQAFKDFRLVGGTSLSLQRGHRRSIDIDLFTDLEYGAMPLSEIKEFIEREFPVCEGQDALLHTSMGYSLRLGDGIGPKIKVDLFYVDPFIFPVIEEDGIRMADQREIAAMKLLAIAGPVKRQKDYWDIHELLQDYNLDEMIEWSLKRHPFSLSKKDVIAGLMAIDDVEESPEGIDSLRPLDYWELKVMDLKELLASMK